VAGPAGGHVAATAMCACVWLGGVKYTASDLRTRGCGFDLQP